MLAEKLAYFMMKSFKKNKPSASIFHYAEVFNTDDFKKGTLDQRREMMRNSSKFRYDSMREIDAFSTLFPQDLFALLRDKVVLDLGCFTGGKSVFWIQKYNIKKIYGLDINEVFIQAATEFAKIHGVNAEFKKGFGEDMPFSDNMFDAIISWDVFEHVQNYSAVLSECYRTLKPGGYLLSLFPTYYNPIASHLEVVTEAPFLTWLFSGQALTRAYNRLVEEGGEKLSHFRRNSAELKAWERSHVLNGITNKGFRNALSALKFQVIYYYQTGPFLGISGKRGILYYPVKRLVKILQKSPLLNEFVTMRIICILRKTL